MSSVADGLPFSRSLSYFSSTIFGTTDLEVGRTVVVPTYGYWHFLKRMEITVNLAVVLAYTCRSKRRVEKK